MRLMFDIECYVNYFLLGLKNVDTGNKLHFEMRNDNDADFDRAKIKRLIENNTVVGFNSEDYDIPVVTAAIYGATNSELKKLSDSIIIKNLKYWQVNRNLPKLKTDHIDLINIAPGAGSLKLYGGRLNAPKLQDLPIEPSAVISGKDAKELRDYCLNGDLELTELIYNDLAPQIELRRNMSAQYKINLLTKSDAQIAEAVFKHELTEAGVEVYKIEVEPGTQFEYKIPSFISFKSEEFIKALQDVKDAVFVVSEKGSVLLPKSLYRAYKFDGAKYKMGIGGLHSQEKQQVVIAGPGQTLVDKDVKAYYPWIILNQNLHPEHLGKGFVSVYRSIVERRMAAKAVGDKVTDATLKIVINSSFGKFGSKYSTMYSPDLLIQTTITGQLSLMMLIERLSAIGVRICSANTDGIVLLFDDELAHDVELVCFNWELDTGFELEDTFYKAVYSRDVNNYLAIKPNNSSKGKGIFTLGSLSKNPANVICYEAVINYLVEGIPLKNTIDYCTEVHKFTSIRTVAGGATFEGEVIGKSIRWYYSDVVDGCITYAKNGNKVPKTDGARPMMELLDTLPDDLDYGYYFAEAKTILEGLGL